MTDAGEQELLRRIEATFNAFDSHLDLYVACFCTDDDVLSQWRGYAGGGGYSIGFRTTDLMISSASVDDLSFALHPVRYDVDEQRTLMESLLGRALDVVERVRQEQGEEAYFQAMPECCSFIEHYVLYYLITFKDPVFDEEKEWRLVQFGSSVIPELGRDVAFRARGQAIIPYVVLQPKARVGIHAAKLPIERIVCGPMQPIGSDAAIAALLARYDYQFCEVQSSKVPLRWC